jgi:23S rRNA (uracil1939-C5)-methyltransferase
VKKAFPLTIEKIALGGSGLGFAEGKAIFVPYTAPGDEIEAVLVSERKDMAYARVAKYLKRGVGVEPTPCGSFAADPPCGGCDWLELDYPTQLKYKSELIRDLLQPLVPGLEIPGTLASPDNRHYRNKSFMPVGSGANGLKYGIFARWSHQIVSHESCELHPPIFDTIAARCLEIFARTGVHPYNEASHTGTLRHIGFRCSRDRSRILLILVTRSGKLPFTQLLVKQLTDEFPALSGIVQNINRERGNVILGPEEKILYGEPWLQDRLGELAFRVHYRSFWQVNTGTLELIISHLKRQLDPDDIVYDAFSGIGALGLSLSGSVKQVLCIEEVPAAVADGEANINLNGIANAGFVCARTEDALPALLDQPGNGVSTPDAIILDPPRGGVQASVLHTLINSRIPRIFYLSCSPMTLKRDLKILLESGSYRITHIQPFDMFPHTWHIETLVGLELINKAVQP